LNETVLVVGVPSGRYSGRFWVTQGAFLFENSGVLKALFQGFAFFLFFLAFWCSLWPSVGLLGAFFVFSGPLEVLSGGFSVAPTFD